MELRHLRYFVAIAEEQSLTRAAARLHIAQPPLSAQLRKLETELGAVLVHRTARGTQLTDAGRVLLEEARRILHEVDHAAQMTREAGSGRVGRLSLGFIPSASNVVLPPILRQFKARYPEVRLRLREMRPDEIVERLHDRRIDAGFFYLPIDDPSLHVRSVADDSLVLALPSTHPLADSPEVDLRAVAGEPFILPPRYDMPGLYTSVTQACERAGFTPRVVQPDVWLMQTIVGLVAGGMGIAVVPSSVQQIPRAGATFVPLTDVSATARMAMAWRREIGTPVLRSFLDIAAAAPEQPGAAGGVRPSASDAPRPGAAGPALPGGTGPSQSSGVPT
ncbi:LysR family transcriptional regulator [Saccharopolyspora erythraea NRRL 2338]|uniref:Transcriptional regulator, LysR family n=2 Tax=Saccharopolyspora erythraea TaxID=1836 RepID=A4F7Y9_SACEN|nr:LysR family transcriptional regulator [Saccharopolyspora erythraea]EQD85771.1 LysR family transcriptional regulator [Saccharopolyspora erythraea D]PFG93960.1 LysR family transcriptional regulator [Saccharopolyspora erythraea NRRL 2338]QRK90776.1 LysR family transcriptional regulator [Saccharopolyspora erythraea]CAM00163.1 transcriptional regulator, LysR family [Saccharopolyspora erythraea NRRL 2338]